jgi:hypothetical protein
MTVRGRSRLIVTDSLTRCIETLIGTTGDLFEDQVPSHTLVRLSALTKGTLVAPDRREHSSRVRGSATPLRLSRPAGGLSTLSRRLETGGLN